MHDSLLNNAASCCLLKHGPIYIAISAYFRLCRNSDTVALLSGADKGLVYRDRGCYGNAEDGALYSPGPPLPTCPAPLPRATDSNESANSGHAQSEWRGGDVSPALLAIPGCPHYFTFVDALVCDDHIAIKQLIGLEN